MKTINWSSRTVRNQLEHQFDYQVIYNYGKFRSLQPVLTAGPHN